MPTYGYNRSITRVAVNPRLAFGVPLDKLCSEGRLHPGLRDLFLKAHLCADSESSLRRKRNQPSDASDVVLKLLESREHGLGRPAERLFLKERLEAGEWIVATPTSPGAPLGLLEHFLGCLPSPIFGEEIWRQLSEECKEYVEKAVTGSPNTHILIQKLSKCLKRLGVGEYLTVLALLGLMCNLATDDRTKELDKTAVMALVQYFIPSLVSRPVRSGVTSSESRQTYPLLLFLCYYWPEIREECENVCHRTSRCSSLTSIEQKAAEIDQKKCMSLPNNGIDKQQNFKQGFVKSTDIAHGCIYLYRNKANNNAIKHKPQCIWKPIFLEKEVDEPNVSDDKNHIFKPASLFICTCCGICSEKVDQETQYDDSVLLYDNERCEKHGESAEIQFEYASKSSSVAGNCGSEREFREVFRASAFDSSSMFCTCHFRERGANDSKKNENECHQHDLSRRTSMSYLLKDLLTSSTEVPFYTKDASSMTCFNDIKPFMAENLKISTETKEKTAFCSTRKGNVKDSIDLQHLRNEINRETNDMPISESSAIPMMQDGLKRGNKGEHMYSASGRGGNNPCKSTQYNQEECEMPFAGKFLKPRSEDDRSHTELLMVQNWEKNQEVAVKQKHSVVKSKTYPPQSSSTSKDVLATTSANGVDEHPRRNNEPFTLPRTKRLRFKPKQWLREALKHGRMKISGRTKSRHEPDTSQ